jgi:SAP domain-containing ribonucleoprotein
LLPQEDLKKKQRAERFGLPVPVSKEEFEAKRKARADRFGSGAAAEAMKSGMTEEHKKKLEERAKR